MLIYPVVVALAVSVGVLSALVVTHAGSLATSITLFVGITAASTCLVLVPRMPWLPAAAYWIIYSFASDARLWYAPRLGAFPITIPDVVVGYIFLANIISTRSRDSSLTPPSPIAVLLLIFAADSAFAAAIGTLRGQLAYSILIDLRFVVYLVVGYWAGRRILSPVQRPRLVEGLMWMTLAGFTFETVLILAGGLQIAPQGGQSLINQRDIGVSYFAGKYGVFFAIVVALTSTSVRAYIARTASVIGIVATAATFVRTAWVATAAGLGVIAWVCGRTAVRGAAAIAVIFVLVLGLAEVAPAASPLFDSVIYRFEETFQPSSPAFDTVAIRTAESNAALAKLESPQDWLVGNGLGLVVNEDAVHPYLHNSFVGILAKQGIIGLIIFSLALIAIPFAYGLRALRRVSGKSRNLLIVAMAAIAANGVSGYASGNMTSWELAPLIGMTVAWIDDLSRSVRLATNGARRPTDIGALVVSTQARNALVAENLSPVPRGNERSTWID